MYAYLREHPALFLPERKELRYFGRDLEIRDRRPLTMDEYLAHFAAANPGQLVGTAYVWYLFSTEAAREIVGFNPDARIIAMLRNPIEMLHALHGEHLSNGNEEIGDFTAALHAEPDRRMGRRIPRHEHLVRGLWYSAVPRYTEQLKRYADAFGRERLHVILFDDFAGEPEAAHRGVLRFLEVPDDGPQPTFEVVNASKRTRSERLRHFLARPPEAPRRVIRRIVPGPVRRALYDRAKKLNVVPASRPAMPPETREWLRLQFGEEVKRLSAFLDRDLTHWTAPPAETASKSG